MVAARANVGLMSRAALNDSAGLLQTAAVHVQDPQPVVQVGIVRRLGQMVLMGGQDALLEDLAVRRCRQQIGFESRFEDQLGRLREQEGTVRLDRRSQRQGGRRLRRSAGQPLGGRQAGVGLHDLVVDLDRPVELLGGKLVGVHLQEAGPQLDRRLQEIRADPQRLLVQSNRIAEAAHHGQDIRLFGDQIGPVGLIGQMHVDFVEGLLKLPGADQLLDGVVVGHEIIRVDQDGGVEGLNGPGMLAGGDVKMPQRHQGRNVVGILLLQGLVLRDGLIQPAVFEVDRPQPLGGQLQSHH